MNTLHLQTQMTFTLRPKSILQPHPRSDVTRELGLSSVIHTFLATTNGPALDFARRLSGGISIENSLYPGGSHSASVSRKPALQDQDPHNSDPVLGIDDLYVCTRQPYNDKRYS